MIDKNVHFNGYLTKFLGRNGTFKCSGVSVDQYDSIQDRPFIEIKPVTSKDVTGRSFIQIPMSHLGEFIKALTEIETEWMDQEQQ